ncbi:hypothetical protein AHF37_10713 [Paragonimus kellicotti]|nr:hypothetical protein AHF37_10713 [Paragonimus kellicotti]
MDVSDSTGNKRFTSDRSFLLVDSRPCTFASTRSHILTEMQSFRHVDSEIDLTHSRQLDSDSSDVLIAVRPRLIQSSETFDWGTHSNPGASCNSSERSTLSHVDLHANRPCGPVLSCRSGAVIPELLSVASRIPSIDCAGGGSRILGSDSAPVQLSTMRVSIRPLIANSADSFGPMTPVMERSTEDYSLSSLHQCAVPSTQRQADVLDISGFSPQRIPVTGSSASSPTDTHVGLHAILSSLDPTRHQQHYPEGSPTVFGGSELLDGSTYDDVALS